MENYQVFRTLALLQERVTKLEGGAIAPPVVSSGNVANLDVNSRLAALEGRPPVTLDDVNGRLSALEGRPDVTQRISALELTIASLNNS
jgi:hypothetical protein